ncbi:hypothetical protein B0I72DRAFT_134316 [Yarrowia lipolytica]|uniref:YALI0F14003p n=3 Tax=Yarrowia lipolytica TaxID=4952 RepID=Q6C1R9_YARLI|nr:YALI0F14003p [Yarrowia lipolytica CLIB122]6YJ4_h Chain h, subunit NUNM of protein NADH:Ubiquinone Oxidoreductase (Complex I) [Yarrowia lipolytica]7B0N_h Chain h, subunit NUNM of protein NADH:Ubiquinone Oxidoreductase (Complex I) [Yarrowia lipolytica]7O6Y_n Chain n, Subunit NUNM of NADH:Ubiquinone Oxidoreductase (Complex I) [Yarrowia lipolytica]KAB8281674.1 hypothetical protein BKA91DRAFT_139707 [Yarrowia lipolytica]KAE8171895.1 hypothetical protein BKA90DRAFT_138173 [Yarrowia lipolytica]KA|eukprot:XP_505393.2 YALI0F14003p [Yarrowia lipolytica CLIB122]
MLRHTVRATQTLRQARNVRFGSHGHGPELTPAVPFFQPYVLKWAGVSLGLVAFYQFNSSYEAKNGHTWVETFFHPKSREDILNEEAKIVQALNNQRELTIKMHELKREEKDYAHSYSPLFSDPVPQGGSIGKAPGSSRE